MPQVTLEISSSFETVCGVGWPDPYDAPWKRAHLHRLTWVLFNLECVHHLPCVGLSTDPAALWSVSHCWVLNEKQIWGGWSSQAGANETTKWLLSKEGQSWSPAEGFPSNQSHKINCLRVFENQRHWFVVAQELGTSRQDHSAPGWSFCLFYQSLCS